MMRIFLILALLLSLIVTVFAIQNNTDIDVTFLRWHATGSLALVLMITMISGIGIGVMLMLPGSVRARLNGRSERKRSQQLEAELAGLRPLPEVKLDPGNEAEMLQQASDEPGSGDR
jgi:putative membrane protein